MPRLIRDTRRTYFSIGVLSVAYMDNCASLTRVVVMRRRDFIKIFGATVAFWPLTAKTQQAAMPVIGFLNSSSPDQLVNRIEAFGQGLREAGFVEGQNVLIEYRWAKNQFEMFPQLAADLLARKVDVIATGYNHAAAAAAKAATAAIPIVFQTGVDPMKTGLVASVSRPGGNLTGVTNVSNQLVPKHLQILHELNPAMETVALLVNPTNSTSAEAMGQDAHMAAASMGLQMHTLRASAEQDLEKAVADARQIEAGGLVITPDAFFNSRNRQIASLALRYRVPSISVFRAYAAAGGLLSYGGSATEQGRQAGVYAGRILKGEKPADLPVIQVTKVELVINLKTAKALGLNLSLPLLGRADEVIE
jgi:putative tryptophan/tyrosine transport system substrate-binding protein